MRSWMPADYLDDTAAVGRGSPSAWLDGPDGRGGWLMAAPGDRLAAGRRLAVGDVVAFYAFDDLGSVEVVIHPDRTHSVEGVVPPSAEEFFVEGDPDSLAYDVRTFVEKFIETNAPRESVRVRMRMAWGSEPIVHRLVVDARGVRFEQCEGAS